MDTLVYLVFKRLAKRSPRCTRPSVVASFSHVSKQTLQYTIEAMFAAGYLDYAVTKHGTIIIITKIARQSFPEDFARMQRELDHENQ